MTWVIEGNEYVAVSRSYFMNKKQYDYLIIKYIYTENLRELKNDIKNNEQCF